MRKNKKTRIFIVSLGLSLIALSFSFTQAYATDLSPGVIVGNLDTQARAAKAAGDSTFLQPALGQANLVFTLEDQTINILTGLADANPAVRTCAARLIAELGDANIDGSLISILQASLPQETDTTVKEELYLAIIYLQHRLDLGPAATVGDYTSHGFPSTLKIIEYLRAHTQTEKDAGEATYLQAVLGTGVLTFDYQDIKMPITLSNIGLSDTRPEVRQAAAEIIAEYAEVASLADSLFAALQNKLNSETNSAVKDALNLVLVTLQYKVALDKTSFVNTYLAGYDPFLKGLPALYYIVSQVRDMGLQVSGALTNVENEYFQDQSGILAYLEDTKAILALYQQYSGQALYEQALASVLLNVQQWAIDTLAKGDNPQASQYANSILLGLWYAKKGSLVEALFSAMSKNDAIFSENLNSSFELETGGVPRDWVITKDDAATTVVISTDLPKTFAKCIKINNRTGTTSLKNTLLVFDARSYPSTIEYAMAYRMGDNGTGYLTDDVGPASVTLKAITTFTDSTVATDLITENAPYYLNWQVLGKSFTASKPVRSVQLEATVSGNALEFYLDDISVRRSSDTFILTPPQIQSVSVTPQIILLYPTVPLNAAIPEQSEFLSCNATVTPPGPGDTITGSWVSDVEGTLGSGYTLQARLHKTGEHEISFLATNSAGITQEATTTVDAFRPVVSLTTTADSAQPVSGNVTFNVAVTRDPPLDNAGTPDSSLPAPFTYSGKLYTDYDREIGTIASGTPCVVDTRRLPDGTNTFYAKVNVYRSGTASSSLPFKSDNLVLTVQQSQSTLGVHLSSPAYGSKLTGITPICAEIENSLSAVITRVVFTMQNEQSGVVYTLGTDTAAPYTCNLNPQLYQQFPQTTTYLLFATAYFNLGGGTILDVRSEPVCVTIPAVMPPTNLTAVAANTSIQLHWQDNSNNEKEFCVYRKSGAGGTYVKIARPPTNSIAYLDSASIVPGTQYYYKISALNWAYHTEILPPTGGGGASILIRTITDTVEEFSNEAIVTASLNSPNTLLISQASGDGVQLGWTLPTDRRGITNIVIERKLNLPGEGFTEIGKVGGGATSFLDQSIAKSSYCYRVRAVNALISSFASNEVSVTLDFPNAPLNLAATYVGNNVINLHWTDLSDDETGFVILRSIGTNANFALRASLPANATSFQDSGTLPMFTYYYRVRANKNGQWSASKAEAVLPGPRKVHSIPEEYLIDKSKSSTLQY